MIVTIGIIALFSLKRFKLGMIVMGSFNKLLFFPQEGLMVYLIPAFYPYCSPYIHQIYKTRTRQFAMYNHDLSPCRTPHIWRCLKDILQNRGLNSFSQREKFHILIMNIIKYYCYQSYHYAITYIFLLLVIIIQSSTVFHKLSYLKQLHQFKTILQPNKKNLNKKAFNKAIVYVVNVARWKMHF